MALPKLHPALAFALASLLAVSCAAPAEPVAPTEPPVEVAVPTPTAEPTHAPLVAAATAEPVPPKDDGSVGVPECDEYLKVVVRCMSRMADAEAQKQFVENIDTMRQAWRETASVAPEALSTACRAALDAMKEVPGCAP
ncbi:MAG: hypothetical protein HOV80_19105 [Polyangiaceae bacterium]|nr:hypothetical protein [Polyangiaceae bacterium]